MAKFEKRNIMTLSKIKLSILFFLFLTITACREGQGHNTGYDGPTNAPSESQVIETEKRPGANEVLDGTVDEKQPAKDSLNAGDPKRPTGGNDNTEKNTSGN